MHIRCSIEKSFPDTYLREGEHSDLEHIHLLSIMFTLTLDSIKSLKIKS